MSFDRPKYYRDYKTAARAKARAFLQTAKTGVPCADCGRVYPPYVMDFDHIDPQTKVATVARMATSAMTVSRIAVEVSKCEIVCANCHRIRTHGQPATA